MTKKEMFEAVKAIVVGEEVEVSREEIVEFCEKEIAALEARAGKAKERSAVKKAEGDALAEAIVAVLTEEAQTIAEITAAIDDPEVTVHRVTYRLGKLVTEGKVKREEMTIPATEDAKARKVKAYSIA